MTAPAVPIRPAPAPVRVPAVASLALKRGFFAGDMEASVLGVSNHALWLRAADEVVVVTTLDTTRLPNGVQISATSETGLFDSVAHGASVVLGPHALEFGGFVVDLVRWWEPRPALHRTTADDLGVAIGGLQHLVPGVDSEPLRSAVAGRSPEGLVDAALVLLGRGPGLTPEGDDVLAGALAATRTLGTALGSTPSLAMLNAAEGTLARAAKDRTTTFSAALIRCALRGEVAAPAGSLLRALAGRGDVGSSYRELLRVGHTSGPALAAGIVLGAHALVESQPYPSEVSNDRSG